MSSDEPASGLSFSSLNDHAKRFLSGAGSGTLTAAVLQPFDVIRTVQQGQAAQPDGAPFHRLGPWKTAKKVVGEGGVLSLWRGLGPTVARVFFGAGVYFSSIYAIQDALRAAVLQGEGGASAGRDTGSASVYRGEGGGAGTSRVDTGSGSPAPAIAPAPLGGLLSESAISFLAGVSARILAASLLSPVAVVKTRMEWSGRGRLPYTGTLGGVVHIGRTEGVGALYAGLIPTIVRDAPFSGVYFALYSRLKHVTESPSAVILVPSPTCRNFLAATAAGALATLLTQPADVIRTRLQIGAVPGVGVWQAGTVLLRGLRDLARAEGVRSLFVGGVARIAKRSLSTAATWTLFEEVMRRR